jgi:uncharacterized membrane protein YphA (DoxX/SURF4 family)
MLRFCARLFPISFAQFCWWPGWGTRWAALYCFANILVAWAFVHQFAFFGKGPGSDHGELIVLYLGAMLTLLIAGPGAASVDRLLARKQYLQSSIN